MTSVDKAAIGWSIAIVAIAIGFTLAGQSEPTESVSSVFGVADEGYLFNNPGTGNDGALTINCEANMASDSGTAPMHDSED